jgi:ParB family chromosome partitioning protein
MAKPTRRNLSLLGDAFDEAAIMDGGPTTIFGVRETAGSSFQELDLDKIHPNPWQPRKTFDQEELEGLAATIREKGVVQPVLVRPHPTLKGEYQLAAGERRIRASGTAGKATIPAIVRALSDADMATVAITENLQRADLNAVEEANALRQLLAVDGMTQARLAQQLGKSKTWISLVLRITELPETIRAELEGDADLRSRISREQLIEIAKAKDCFVQASLWKAAKRGVAAKALRDAEAITEEGKDWTGKDHGKAARVSAGKSPLATVMGSYGRWAKALRELRTEDIGEEERSKLKALKARLEELGI